MTNTYPEFRYDWRMLFIHASNQLEQLSRAFSRLVKQPLSNVFSSEVVVVQNAGMRRWLSMQHAKQRGLSANIQYLFPAEYMWELLRKVMDIQEDGDPAAPSVLKWRLFELFLQRADNYPELAHYLQNEMAALDLADALAPVLDQYLFYRDDWIKEWESGQFSESDWQARLWQQLIMDESGKQRKIPHWLALQEKFQEIFVERFDANPDVFPQRVSFFSVPTLSPGYLGLLEALSEKIDVHFFVINPCREYWGDIESLKKQLKRSSDTQSYYDVGNALLASMGRQGRDFIDQLYALESQSKESTDWLESASDSILHCVQRNVLNLEDREVESTEFESIQFHACHTIMREVEVLHDQILSAIESSDDLTPADIVVMTPAIDRYAPYIEAVFSTAEHNLPYSIADRSMHSNQAEVEVFSKLLALPEARFNVEAVFELLEYEVIRNNFVIDESQLQQCRDWVRATNIRWGVSRQKRVKEKLSDTFEHTWKYGIDRMLLGYMMPNDAIFAESELLSFNEIEGSNGLLLAAFKSFTDTVFDVADWVDQSLVLNDWIDKVQQLLKSLFGEQGEYYLIFNALESFKKKHDLAEYDQALSFAIFKKSLLDLISAGADEHFISRGITFCALVPMRSVPFKMVALLGMNDAEYPRQDKRHSFDKIANSSRRGDRSRRDEDRYLFLESILAARQRLYISYQGQCVQDNTSLPPSVVVSELLDYLFKMTGIEQDQWITKHPLQAFSPRYYQQNSKLFSYVKDYLSIYECNQQHFDDLGTFFRSALEPLEDAFKQISLDQLLHFYRSPARAFLSSRFGIQTFNDEDVLQDREPFVLEPFVDKQVRQQIMAVSSENIDYQTSMLLARAKGLLPYGAIGDEVFDQEKQLIEAFYRQYTDLASLQLESLSFELALDEFKLFGQLKNITEQGNVYVSFTQFYAAEVIEIWIQHLVLNCINPESLAENQTTVYQPKESLVLLPLRREEAQALLSRMLKGYWSGLQRPLHFAPKPAMKMYQSAKPNLNSAISSWSNSFLGMAEADKFENQLLFAREEFFDQEFEELAEVSFGKMKEMTRVL